MQIRVLLGTVERQPVDAIVNKTRGSPCWNEPPELSRRIAEKAPELDAAVRALDPMDVGESAVTDGYELDVDHVVHVCIEYRDGNSGQVDRLTRTLLSEADDLGAESIAFRALNWALPLLSDEKYARWICEEIDAFDASSLETVVLVVDDQEAVETVRSVLQEVRGR